MRKRLLAAALGIACLAALTTVFQPSAALATHSEAPFDYTWRAESIKSVRDQARTQQQLRGLDSEPQLLAAREDFIRDAKARGREYVASDIDVFELSAPTQQSLNTPAPAPARSVIVAVPKSYEMQYIRRADDKGNVIVVADGAANPAKAGSPRSKTMGSWNPTDGGQYTITITLSGQWIGKMLTMWQAQKFEDDSNTADWFGYTNKAIATPNENLEGRVTDYEVGYMRNRTAPVTEDFSSPTYHGGAWQDMAPAIPFEGNCDELEYPVTATIGAIGIEIPVQFKDCDEYTPIWDAQYVGTYMLEMSQGSWLGDGPRELGYALAFKMDAGHSIRTWGHGQILRLIDQAGTGHNVAECGWSGQDHTCEVLEQENLKLKTVKP